MAGLLDEGAAIVKNQFKIPNAITKPESFTNELAVPSIGPDMEFLANQYGGSREDLNQYLAALVCGDVSLQIKCQPQSDFVALYKGNDKIAKLLVELYKVLPIEVRKLTTVATDLDSDFAWNSEGRLLALNSVNGQSIQNLVKAFQSDSSTQARDRIDLVQSEYIEKLYDGEKLVRSYRLPQLLSTMPVELDDKPNPVADTSQNTTHRNSVSVKNPVSESHSDGNPGSYPRLGLFVSLVLGLMGGALISYFVGKGTHPPNSSPINGIEVACPEVTVTPPTVTTMESIDAQNEELSNCRALNNEYYVSNENMHAELAKAKKKIQELVANVEKLNSENANIVALNVEQADEIAALKTAKANEIAALKTAKANEVNALEIDFSKASNKLRKYQAEVTNLQKDCSKIRRCRNHESVKAFFLNLNYEFPVSRAP